MIEIDKSSLKIKRKKKSIIWEMPLSDFKELVSKSESIGQALKFFKLENKGRNNETLKRRCLEEGVDISHWKMGKASNRGRKFFVKKTPIEKLLVENSSFNRTHLKERLLEEKILEYKCCGCNNTGEWNGKPITLQLEHKNGVSNDNRIENICFLCPNCHSQTHTYAGKKVKLDRNR
jgi:Zn finger protein HypA/HybF involved in hydrogenase expression